MVFLLLQKEAYIKCNAVRYFKKHVLALYELVVLPEPSYSGVNSQQPSLTCHHLAKRKGVQQVFKLFGTSVLRIHFIIAIKH